MSIVPTKTLAALCVLSLLTTIAAPAFAQASRDDDPIIMDQARKKKEAEEIDRRYRATLKNTDKAATPVHNDPWQNMRGVDDAKGKR